MGSVTAKAFGIAFDLAEELRPIYTRFGHALPDKNGDDSWVLPIPATYVIDSNRTVALAGRGVYLSVWGPKLTFPSPVTPGKVGDA